MYLNVVYTRIYLPLYLVCIPIYPYVYHLHVVRIHACLPICTYLSTYTYLVYLFVVCRTTIEEKKNLRDDRGKILQHMSSEVIVRARGSVRQRARRPMRAQIFITSLSFHFRLFFDQLKLKKVFQSFLAEFFFRNFLNKFAWIWLMERFFCRSPANRCFGARFFSK